MLRPCKENRTVLKDCLTIDLGMIGYAEAYALQKRIVAARKAGAIEDVLLLCEHPPVITLGRSGKRENLLRREQIFTLAASPQRNYRRMLAKQKHIFDRAGLPRGHNALLQRVSFRVADHSQIDGEAIFQHGSIFFAGAQHAAPLQARSQTLICSPRTLANASPIASQTVGWACIMFIMSSMVPSRFNTVAASARSSVASGPMM